jgi:hypothetical protein
MPEEKELKRLVLHDGPRTEGEKAFDEALDHLNGEVRKANIPPDTALVTYCRCPCHYSPMMHMVACCQGKCKDCKLNIEHGLVDNGTCVDCWIKRKEQNANQAKP